MPQINFKRVDLPEPFVPINPQDSPFLTQGGVFTKDFIEAFINIKRKEVERLNMTPHPVEFEMYYA